MTRPVANNNNTAAAPATDPAAAFRRLHHEHVARLIADLAAQPTDRALGYLFHGQGGTGKSETIAAMAAATGREIVRLDWSTIPINPRMHLVVCMESYYSCIAGRILLRRLMAIPGLIIVLTSLSESLEEGDAIDGFQPLRFGPVSGADAAAIARDHFPDAEDTELAELAAAVDGVLSGGRIQAMCRSRESVREITRACAALVV